MSAGGTTGTAGSQTLDVMATHEAKALLESGRVAGKLLAEDIASALDELDLDTAQMDEFYGALDELQIEVVEARTRPTRTPTPKPRRARSRPTRCSSSSRTSAACRS